MPTICTGHVQAYQTTYIFLIGLSYGQQVKLAGANKDLLTKALEMQSAGEQSIW